ncbi:MAG: hypothetical protein HN580_23265 [Deltaproteobacteria bacterium]|jgi:hypothetical protein|nr:hypothetical protein [Deltaproteobacteria bacterium]MBT4269306.1 hypothetical protein [Deltaproteobacteria bacterium]MBT4643256.1 hypothetical protein [Deltaproteobacteria bacterium]MBT6498541.1 hypothetical protein [Deltaproteobacteria bacterium]MBT6613224.1 hypothetical protein [Deltaproteobacteria bacterium]
MGVLNQDHLFFPTSFNGILIKSIRIYAGSFINYLLLAFITYLPFLILIEFSKLDIMDMVEFFHGNFLDIVIFLTLPTLFIDRKVLPLATISLFVQRFFASAVVISFVQLGTLLFFITFFARISLGAILVGIIPYIFLLFAGFFLIMENAPRLISIRLNLFHSIKLVRGQFFSIFWNFISITILVFLPLFFFSLWYLGSHQEMIVIREGLGNNPEADSMVVQNFLTLVQDIVQENGFKWSRIGIHILFRPLKSLFLTMLFLSIIQRVSPNTIVNFLSNTSNHKTAPDSVEETESDENESGSENTM